MAAALDIVSNGRLELGIGAGWNEEESGAYGIELGTHQGTLRPLRGGVRGADQPAVARRRRPSTASSTSSRTPATSRRARSSRTRRSASAAAARSARCESPRSTPTTGTSSAVRPRSSPASATCWPSHCADIGRDPEGDHAVVARPAGARRPQLRAQLRSTRPPRSARRVWTWRSSTCRRRTTPPCSNRWPKAIRDSGLLTSKYRVTVTKI